MAQVLHLFHTWTLFASWKHWLTAEAQWRPIPDGNGCAGYDSKGVGQKLQTECRLQKPVDSDSAETMPTDRIQMGNGLWHC